MTRLSRCSQAALNLPELNLFVFGFLLNFVWESFRRLSLSI